MRTELIQFELKTSCKIWTRVRTRILFIHHDVISTSLPICINRSVHHIHTLFSTIHIHCLSPYTYTVFHHIHTLFSIIYIHCFFNKYIHCFSPYTYTAFQQIQILFFNKYIHVHGCLPDSYRHNTYTVFHQIHTLLSAKYLHKLYLYY